MLLSTSLHSLLSQDFTLEQCVTICKTAGFDAMDMCFTHAKWHDAETETPEFLNHLIEVRKIAEGSGLVFNQAHAPFFKKTPTVEDPEGCFSKIVRAMKYASVLGVKNIVVHPLQHLTYRNPGVPEQLFELNMEYYGRLQKYCEEYGIVIAVENMFQRTSNHRIIRSVCATPEEFCRYMNHLDNRYFIGCLDIGHAMLTDEPVEFIRKAGHCIGALHVHDNTGFNDDHMMPYCGILDWESITDALRDAKYTGDFTFETVKYTKAYPRELQQDAHNMLAKVGRHLIKRIQA